MTYSPTQDELRELVDARLERALDDAGARLPEARPLIDELRRLTLAGGKRIRPSFCYWGCRAAGGDGGDATVRAAASLELLHTFAIVHDDIMDGSHRRRGVATVNAARGDDVALLAGDLALVLADDELMSSGWPPDVLAGAFGAYSRMRQEVVAGQYLELEIAAAPWATEEDARRVAVLKSGRYSIREPLLIGAALARADGALTDALGTIGESLGEAFQLADDLLGTFGQDSVTGKPVDSDARRGTKNVLYAKTVAALTGRDLAIFDAKWGGGDALTDDDIAELRALMESSGARAATERLAQDLESEALDRLEEVEIADEARTALRDLAVRVTRRDE